MKITNILLVTLSLLLVGAQADIKRDCRQQTNVSWVSLKQLKADVEKALRHLPRNMQESSKRILNRCKSIQAENACDKAFQIAICYVKAQPEILKSVSFII
ncbi:odorant binding protein 9 isoform X2 [Temnothorax americanus]|uniref:odorant binding protein 9 isoform X2 n=1 Tax=Temnothorax americanus TaxID=1964332 RepID=UPI0040693390